MFRLLLGSVAVFAALALPSTASVPRVLRGSSPPLGTFQTSSVGVWLDFIPESFVFEQL